MTEQQRKKPNGVLALVAASVMGVAGFYAGTSTVAPPEHSMIPLPPMEAPRSSTWPTFRKHHLENHPKCEVCGSKESLQVHHKAPFHLHPELEEDPNNVVTLCLRHHFVVGHLENYSSYNMHLDEDIVFWRKRLQERPDKQGNVVSAVKTSCVFFFAISYSVGVIAFAAWIYLGFATRAMTNADDASVLSRTVRNEGIDGASLS